MSTHCYTSMLPELAIGDEIPVRMDEKNLVLNCGTGKEIKVKIVESRRAR